MEQGDTLDRLLRRRHRDLGPGRRGVRRGQARGADAWPSARKGADAVQAAILSEIEGFEQGARATDDRTLVVLKREERA